MNQQLLWTTTALLTTALSAPSVSYALASQSSQSSIPVSGMGAISSRSQSIPPAANISKPESSASPNQAAASNIKVARVQPHELQGRMVATLIVRNVPVLTFVGATPTSTSGQVGAEEFQKLNEPIWRATSVAAKINQLYADNVDASAIKAVWESGGESVKAGTKTQSKQGRYAIKVKDTLLVEIDGTTRLTDTISNPAKDALQATNRLRALLGNAPALNEIAGKKIQLPKDRFLAEISVAGLVKFRLSGLASWYGPGFHGNKSANGETYNQYELTAAHKELPFGTKVIVTNLQNGRSVVVRINDRGPYIEGRIIDLSTAAAGVLGMIQPGVAPVTVDVLGDEVPVASGAIARSPSQKGKD